jgi:hypothetical protein
VSNAPVSEAPAMSAAPALGSVELPVPVPGTNARPHTPVITAPSRCPE